MTSTTLHTSDTAAALPIYSFWSKIITSLIPVFFFLSIFFLIDREDFHLHCVSQKRRCCFPETGMTSSKIIQTNWGKFHAMIQQLKKKKKKTVLTAVSWSTGNWHPFYKVAICAFLICILLSLLAYTLPSLPSLTCGHEGVVPPVCIPRQRTAGILHENLRINENKNE